MVIGPGNSQARFERARSRPTSSITIATRGLLLRSRNGTALRRQVCSAGNAAATFFTGSFSSTFGVGLPGSASEYFGKSGSSSMREYLGATAGAAVEALRFISSSVSRATRSPLRKSNRSAIQ